MSRIKWKLYKYLTLSKLFYWTLVARMKSWEKNKKKKKRIKKHCAVDDDVDKEQEKITQFG